MKSEDQKKEDEYQKRKKKEAEYEKWKEAWDAREDAFDEKVSIMTSHRDASSTAAELENRVTALSIMFKFMIKKFGAPELTDEEWDTLMKPMSVLHMNRVFANCPFPQDGTSCGNCNYYETCTEKRCRADVCSNGYPGRGY